MWIDKMGWLRGPYERGGLEAGWGQTGKGPRHHATELRFDLISYGEALHFSDLGKVGKKRRECYLEARKAVYGFLTIQ